MISTELKSIADPNEECCCEYHLAHKCKEWAFNRLYSLESAKRNILSEENKMVDTWICCGFSPSMEVLPNFTADTEPNAIFKACQWILENKE